MHSILLRQYTLNPDTYRECFHLDTKKPDENYKDFANSLTDTLYKWTGAARDGQDTDHKQFDKVLPSEKRAALCEQEVCNIRDAA